MAGRSRHVMLSVEACAIPDNAFLRHYLEEGYADCYVTDVCLPVTQAEFVEAFYTSAVFKLERFILKWAVSRPSTDLDALALAAGTINRFAAWDVEQRDDTQLLLRDFMGRTRSWLTAVRSGDAPGTTRLYFGSAVVAKPTARGQQALGQPFKALLGFHKLYSVILLHAARSRLLARGSPAISR